MLMPQRCCFQGHGFIIECPPALCFPRAPSQSCTRAPHLGLRTAPVAAPMPHPTASDAVATHRQQHRQHGCLAGADRWVRPAALSAHLGSLLEVEGLGFFVGARLCFREWLARGPAPCSGHGEREGKLCRVSGDGGWWLSSTLGGPRLGGTVASVGGEKAFTPLGFGVLEAQWWREGVVSGSPPQQ